jgi:hypothetical protein
MCMMCVLMLMRIELMIDLMCCCVDVMMSGAMEDEYDAQFSVLLVEWQSGLLYGRGTSCTCLPLNGWGVGVVHAIEKIVIMFDS